MQNHQHLYLQKSTNCSYSCLEGNIYFIFFFIALKIYISWFLFVIYLIINKKNIFIYFKYHLNSFCWFWCKYLHFLFQKIYVFFFSFKFSFIVYFRFFVMLAAGCEVLQIKYATCFIIVKNMPSKFQNYMLLSSNLRGVLFGNSVES